MTQHPTIRRAEGYTQTRDARISKRGLRAIAPQVVAFSTEIQITQLARPPFRLIINLSLSGAASNRRST